MVSSKSQVNVATCLRYDGIFNQWFITNLMPGLHSKNFQNRSIFDEVTTQVEVSSFSTDCVGSVGLLRVTDYKVSMYTCRRLSDRSVFSSIVVPS